MVPVSVCISFGRFTRNVSANNDRYTTFPYPNQPHVMYTTITCVIYVRGCILSICIHIDENSLDSRDSTPASMNKARSVETIVPIEQQSFYFSVRKLAMTFDHEN